MSGPYQFFNRTTMGMGNMVDAEKEYIAAIKLLLDKNRVLTDLLKSEIQKNNELTNKNLYLENLVNLMDKEIEEKNERLYVVKAELLKKEEIENNNLRLNHQFRVQNQITNEISNSNKPGKDKNNKPESKVQKSNIQIVRNLSSPIESEGEKEENTNNNILPRQNVPIDRKPKNSSAFDFRDITAKFKKKYNKEDDFIIIDSDLKKEFEDINSI